MDQKLDYSAIKNLEDLKRARLLAKLQVQQSTDELEYAFHSLPKRVLGSTATWVIGSLASGIAAAYMQGEPGSTDTDKAYHHTGEETEKETSYKEKFKGIGEEILYFSLGKLVETLLKK